MLLQLKIFDKHLQKSFEVHQSTIPNFLDKPLIAFFAAEAACELKKLAQLRKEQIQYGSWRASPSLYAMFPWSIGRLRRRLATIGASLVSAQD